MNRRTFLGTSAALMLPIVPSQRDRWEPDGKLRWVLVRNGMRVGWIYGDPSPLSMEMRVIYYYSSSLYRPGIRVLHFSRREARAWVEEQAK